MSETSKDFSKKLLQRAPSGKLSINGRDEALTNIQAFYEDPENVVLPKHQELIRQRWETVHGLFLKGESEKRICKKIATLYDVSESTVRRDLQDADMVFGSRKLPFEIRRQRAVDMTLEAYRRARKDKDTKGMNAAIANLIKADGLEKEPVELPFEKMEAHIFIIALPPQIEAQLDKVFPIHDGRIDLNHFSEIDIKPIKYADSEDITPQ
jgi:hypothetical protein